MKEKLMKEFIKNEMMVHIPLCSHKEPKNILIISENSNKYEIEVSKHDNINFKSIINSLDILSKLEDDSFDVIISDFSADALMCSQINRILKTDGLLVTNHSNLDNVDENKSYMKVLSSYFKIIMPYNLGNATTALLSSKEYHPTADLNLHRADMLDGLKYYNCDIHIASFAMGNYIRKEYLGVIKN